ncbi:MAG: peptidyl-prolyl cis-trans isomerase [Saprospiraceae bacterium]|nr:peptidyl-prolyl cis-trans isomerase [Saprospiraceae bacterium]
MSVVKERFREDLRNQMLTEKLQNTILGDVNVTPQEVETFFAAIPKDSVPYFNAEVEISEIVYKPKANPEQMKLAKEKLEKIRERILAGESFEKLAQQYSEDYGSAKSGGNLGWVKRGNFVPEFEAVAYNLQKDSLSGIVESEYGLHLIQLMGRRGNSILSRHILVKPRMLDEDYTKAKNYLDSIKKSLSKTRCLLRQLFANIQTKNPNHLPMEVDYSIQKAAIISLKRETWIRMCILPLTISK